ncbi:hypothetical protein VCV18_012678 [Metarhizium anisopliae]
MERNEPTAWEKARTAQVVPPTERGMDEEDSLEIKEVLARLDRGEDGDGGRTEGPGLSEDEGGLWSEAESGQSGKPINEVTSSAMFALNGPPDVHDMEKVLFACNVVNGDAAGRAKAGPTTRVESVSDGRGSSTAVSHIYTFIAVRNSPTRLTPRSSRRPFPRYYRLVLEAHVWHPQRGNR